MKFFIVLVSLFAAVQAKFFFGAPAAGATIRAGQNVTIQIIVPIDTDSAAEGPEEISLVIGIVDCPSSPSSCPEASADLGEILFVGTYESQGEIGNTQNSFENFTFNIPADLSGSASIRAQHNFLAHVPLQSTPIVEYHSVAVEVSSS